MPCLRKYLAVLGLWASLAAGSAIAAPLEWDYTVSARFVMTTGATSLNGAGWGH